MNRFAIFVSKSKLHSKEVWIDSKNFNDIIALFESKSAYRKKFELFLKLYLENLQLHKDLFEKEKINSNTSDVYALKLGKGSNNARVYCKLMDNTETQKLILCEALEKKKNQKLSNHEKSIIEKIASYRYGIRG